jgi:hypothetical protein
MNYISADDLYKMSWNKLVPPWSFTYNNKEFTFNEFPDVLGKAGEEQLNVWDQTEFEADLRATFKGNVGNDDIQNFIGRWEANPRYSVHPGAASVASVASVADGEDGEDEADGADGETKQDDLLDDRISGTVFLKLRL